MTKFEQKSFGSPANNKNYEKNYDKVFGKERNLIAEGYCHHFEFGDDEEHAVLVMKLLGGEEENWDVHRDKLHLDVVAGSYLKMYDDGNIELFAPKWTQEEIDEIEECAKRYDAFFDYEDDDE